MTMTMAQIIPSQIQNALMKGLGQYYTETVLDNGKKTTKDYTTLPEVTTPNSSPTTSTSPSVCNDKAKLDDAPQLEEDDDTSTTSGTWESDAPRLLSPATSAMEFWKECESPTRIIPIGGSTTSLGKKLKKLKTLNLLQKEQEGDETISSMKIVQQNQVSNVDKESQQEAEQQRCATIQRGEDWYSSSCSFARAVHFDEYVYEKNVTSVVDIMIDFDAKEKKANHSIVNSNGDDDTYHRLLRTELWYQDYEFDEIRQRIYDLVDLVDQKEGGLNGFTITGTAGKKPYIRGLEGLLKDQALKRNTLRDRTWDVILEEQYFQYSEKGHIFDVDVLARISQDTTWQCCIDAQRQGILDSKQAAIIYGK